MKKLAVFLLLIAAALPAQDFSFGFGDEAASGGGFSVSVSGEISSSITGFIDDFSNGLDKIKLGDIFAGKLNFFARTPIAEGTISLKLRPAALLTAAAASQANFDLLAALAATMPISIDEAYLCAFFGGFDIEAGLRKLTWGKADVFGPLDVINPLDSSQIFTEMADNIGLLGVKIARPLLHASFRFGQFSKIEGVVIPNFEPYRFETTGRWAPSQMELMDQALAMNILQMPDTTTLDYFQAGLRYTTTFGPVDFGAQYYYGRLPRPAAKIIPNLTPPAIFPEAVNFLYNRYHQIGLDYAQVLFGFNIRAEVAANITEDLKGDDGSIYNPSISWHLGFDRDLVWGINLNIQVNESIRLMHDKLGPGYTLTTAYTGILDIENGAKLTATQLIATISKKFLRDELELRAAAVWGIEDKDCVILPALIWTKDDIRIALSGGIFMGDSKGQLGQYNNNDFIKASITYTF